MRLTRAQAAILVRLEAGESLPRSQLARTVLQPLQQAGVVLLEQSGSSYVVRGIPEKLAAFVSQHWGIRDLARYADAMPNIRTRGALARIAGNTKALPSRPFDGIFIRSFNNCFLADQSLNTNPPGSATLITLGELPRLRIESPCLIAIENAECLWRFERTLNHFPELVEMEYALVLRWHWGSPWRAWLSNWSGQLLYFPDYDPAGLRIFVTEVLPLTPAARLLVPENFEAILNQRGQRALFLKQERYLNARSEHPETSRVIQALRKLRKALEQEALLS